MVRMARAGGSMQVGDLVMLPSSLGYIRDKPNLKLIGVVVRKWNREVTYNKGIRIQEYVNVQWANGNECDYRPEWLEVLCK